MKAEVRAELVRALGVPSGAILAVGAIEEKLAVVNGQIVIQQRMRLTGSFDHRIIDGAMGAKFLQEVKKILENPVQLLL
jgi:pyruvate dehydrogenase E2 component (dihydrolipoamide acetyltransferase)